jgi:hypothetical protein
MISLILLLLASAFAIYTVYVKYKKDQARFRPGSKGRAESKSESYFLVAAVVAILLFTLCMTTFDTDFHKCFVRASFIENALGLISIVGGVYVLFLTRDTLDMSGASAIGYAIGILVLIAGGASLACGFDFGGFGI